MIPESRYLPRNACFEDTDGYPHFKGIGYLREGRHYPHEKQPDSPSLDSLDGTDENHYRPELSLHGGHTKSSVPPEPTPEQMREALDQLPPEARALHESALLAGYEWGFKHIERMRA